MSLPLWLTLKLPPSVPARKLFVLMLNRPAKKLETEAPPMIFQL